MLSQIVIDRLKRGEAQKIHIPFPAELGEYGDRSITDADLDAWVARNISIPDNMLIVGTCGGRAHYGSDLKPCICVTVEARRLASMAYTGPVPVRFRSTWADGRGGAW